MTLQRRAFFLALVGAGSIAIVLAATAGNNATNAGAAVLPIEHFKCYELQPASFEVRKVGLRDQFGSRVADITNRNELCNPVRKNDEPFENKRAHLVCYETRGPRLDLTVDVLNQFGRQQLLVKRPERLCVPSQKRLPDEEFRPITTSIDHFQCYRVEELTKITRPRVKLRDQFGRERVKVRKAFRLCNPVDKNNEGIINPLDHLVCYEIVDEPVVRAVEVLNQFEQQFLNTVQPNALCVPSSKTILPPPE